MDGISLQQFGVSFPSFTLGPIDLELAAGDRIALLGSNGAGKSTTINALAGVLLGYAGSVRIGDNELRDLGPEYGESVGHLPEELTGLPWMTVAERLDFLSNFYPGWDATYASELLDRLELPGSKKIGALSKGMKLKFSFVAAEAHRPPLVLLDEPTSGLDPVVRRVFLDTLVEVMESGPPRILIFSTHILEDVSAVANRVCVLRDGSLVDDAPMESFVARAAGRQLSDVFYDSVAGGVRDHG